MHNNITMTELEKDIKKYLGEKYGNPPLNRSDWMELTKDEIQSLIADFIRSRVPSEEERLKIVHKFKVGQFMKWKGSSNGAYTTMIRVEILKALTELTNKILGT